MILRLGNPGRVGGGVVVMITADLVGRAGTNDPVEAMTADLVGPAGTNDPVEVMTADLVGPADINDPVEVMTADLAAPADINDPVEVMTADLAAPADISDPAALRAAIGALDRPAETADPVDRRETRIAPHPTTQNADFAGMGRS